MPRGCDMCVYRLICTSHKFWLAIWTSYNLFYFDVRSSTGEYAQLVVAAIALATTSVDAV